jgi:hypothetical protein
MVNDVTSSASDSAFDPPQLDICLAYHEKSILQRRGSSSAVMQLFFSNLTTVGVRTLSIAMVHLSDL